MKATDISKIKIGTIIKTVKGIIGIVQDNPQPVRFKNFINQRNAAASSVGSIIRYGTDYMMPIAGLDSNNNYTSGFISHCDILSFNSSEEALKEFINQFKNQVKDHE